MTRGQFLAFYQGCTVVWGLRVADIDLCSGYRPGYRWRLPLVRE
jgi:hypothetical protein